MNAFLGLLVRLVLLAAGLAFAAVLAVLFLFLMLVAALHAGWARLRGRPVTAFAFRVDPRAGFRRFYRPAERSAPPFAQGPRALGARTPDVTDVKPRRPGGTPD